MPNRILIVEDDKGISDGIAVNLQYAGYDYAVFGDGREAAEYMEQDHSFDLALLDIMLPGASGLEICQQVKRAYGDAAPPVILISARGQQADIEAGLEAGANDYIIKPFSTRLLLERIEAVL